MEVGGIEPSTTFMLEIVTLCFWRSWLGSVAPTAVPRNDVIEASKNKSGTFANMNPEEGRLFKKKQDKRLQEMKDSQ